MRDLEPHWMIRGCPEVGNCMSANPIPCNLDASVTRDVGMEWSKWCKAMARDSLEWIWSKARWCESKPVVGYVLFEEGLERCGQGGQVRVEVIYLIDHTKVATQCRNVGGVGVGVGKNPECLVVSVRQGTLPRGWLWNRWSVRISQFRISSGIK